MNTPGLPAARRQPPPPPPRKQPPPPLGGPADAPVLAIKKPGPLATNPRPVFLNLDKDSQGVLLGLLPLADLVPLQEVSKEVKAKVEAHLADSLLHSCQNATHTAIAAISKTGFPTQLLFDTETRLVAYLRADWEYFKGFTGDYMIEHDMFWRHVDLLGLAYLLANNFKSAEESLRTAGHGTPDDLISHLELLQNKPIEPMWISWAPDILNAFLVHLIHDKDRALGILAKAIREADIRDLPRVIEAGAWMKMPLDTYSLLQRALGKETTRTAAVGALLSPFFRLRNHPWFKPALQHAMTWRDSQPASL